jgi:hypothetical protein
MDVGSLFLALALVLVVILFVGRPFFSPNETVSNGNPVLSESAEHRRSTLLAERDRLLTALQELDFDNSLGKIPEEDYPATRASLVQSTALVLRRLDEFEDSVQRGTAEERVEQAVASRRIDAPEVSGEIPVGGTLVEPDDLEELIAARRREREEKSAGFCPKCGRPASKSDRFCSKCGTVL